jgi:lactate permease
MIWTQNYDPAGSAVVSTLLAALPVVVLLGLLGSGKVSAHWSAVAGLVTAFLLSVLVFVPVEAQQGARLEWSQTMLAATIQGALFGLFPIGWIVLAAIFLYSMTVHTGHFEIVKESVVNLSADRRIQALLIAFSFGAFIEGAAGFGTPVAISAALMMGAGFKPLHAAGLALIANTSPVAFGALGTPILTLSRVTGISELELNLASIARLRRELCHRPILGCQLPWSMARRRGWRHHLARCLGIVLESVAAADDLEIC